MRNIVKPVLALAALALAAATSAAPAAVAAEARPAGTASIAAAGNETHLVSGLNSAWIHFQPNYSSDHLVVDGRDYLSTVCYDYAGGEYWDLVVDHNKTFAGYTLESYLTTTSSTPCNGVGIEGSVNLLSWVHLYPHADWAYMVANPGERIRSICYVWNTDTDGRLHRFDLVVDRDHLFAGFAVSWALTNPVSSSLSSAC